MKVYLKSLNVVISIPNNDHKMNKCYLFTIVFILPNILRNHSFGIKRKVWKEKVKNSRGPSALNFFMFFSIFSLSKNEQKYVTKPIKIE